MNSLARLMRRQGQVVLNAVFPRICEGCGEECAVDDPVVCWDCLARLPRLQAPFCSCCGHPVEGRIDHDYLCVICSRKPRRFDFARAALMYQGVSQQLVLSFKYRQALWLRSFFGDCLDACVTTYLADHPVTAVVGVPLHPAKRRGRGFNQADLLAEHLSRTWGWPRLGSRALIRVKQTPTQTRLTARQRISNVKGSFRVPCPEVVTGQHIVVVDDVMTTGATVNECAKVLRDAGALSVNVITVARGK